MPSIFGRASGAVLFAAGLMAHSPVQAFDSGSTGADGDLVATVSREVPLPPSGVLNYRSVNIPAGVTITFRKNATNTPVTMLVQTDATIAGSISLDATPAANTGRAGDGNLLDDGNPGEGGPGGFSGGRGGQTGVNRRAGNGLGPGGGVGGDLLPGCFGGCQARSPVPTCGSGAGHATLGDPGGFPSGNVGISGGPVYGNDGLLPLLGGSGGGGANGGARFVGPGGGGGGGAIMVAASGTLSFTGSIRANGARGGTPDTNDLDAGAGGGGSGGSVRLVATRLAGNGSISVNGGSRTSATLPSPFGLSGCTGGSGSNGRIRLEAETFGFVGSTSVTALVGLPSPLFLPGNLGLRFVSVGGVAVPASPSGLRDVSIASSSEDPVAILLATSGVPVGVAVRVGVTPRNGVPVEADSAPTTGAIDNASTVVSLAIPVGDSTLQASVSFNITVAQGEALSRFAQRERVERVTLTTTIGQGAKAVLETGSGKTFEVLAEELMIAGIGGQ